MKVCIAEKPSVAKEIAYVIGAKTRKDGYYEGNGYQVTWTFGHFCTLLPPQDYQPQWKRWDLDALPMLPERFETKIMSNDGVKKQFKIIKGLFKKAALVINCGDAGTEGELIQRWVIKEARYKGPQQRLWISSLTSDAIRKGFQELKPASDFDNLYYAASSRAIGDWLLGMNATRLYTLKYGGYKQVLSIGRVQTPTLDMLVKRHYEIENFVPQAYWELHTLYRKVTFKNTTGRFENPEQGQELLDQITGKDLVITKVEKKDGKEYAPKLYDLTSIQVHCNNKYGFSAEKTLKVVQKLYEMKVVSYPRVDTTYLPEDVYPKVPNILKGLKDYIQYTDPILKTKIRKSKKVFDDNKVTDHHAIIPTGEQQHLSGEQQQVYDMIVRRFLAVFLPDCKVAKTTVKAKVETVNFIAKGKEIIDAGWRVLFPKKDKSSDEASDGKEKDDDKVLPSFKEGEKGPHKPSLLEKMTKAPSYYTEASLLRAMETAGKQVDDDELRELMKANGIGRPSTRANIIETLFRRKYTYRRKKQVLPTEMGIQLIDTIKNKLLISAELTGQWEKRLKQIEHGSYSPKPFIQDMKKMVEDLVHEVRLENNVKRFVSPTNNTNTKWKKKGQSKAKKKSSIRNNKTQKGSTTKAKMQCPKCSKGTIIKGHTRYGCTQYKSGCDFGVPFVFMGKKISDNQIKRLVEKGSTVKLKGFVSENGKVDGTISIDNNNQLIFNPSTKTDTKAKTTKSKSTEMPPCPKCKKGQLIKGKSAYGCSRWKSGCDFRFSFADIKTKAAGQKLTKELVLKIISC